jgi:hypothetical protein
LTGQGSPTASIYRSIGEASRPESEHGSIKGKISVDAPSDVASEDEDGFGDDFDEFEEGQEADDFGDFDDGFRQQENDAEELSTEDSPSLPAVASTYPSVVSDSHSILHLLNLHNIGVQSRS